MAIKDINALFSSPHFLPVAFGSKKGTVLFRSMDRASYASSVFLGIRTVVPLNNNAFEARMDDLCVLREQLKLSPRPVHFVLHTGYCCSTLLARSLEHLPYCFVLKEPQILAQHAVNKHQGDADWETHLATILDLLCRTFSPKEFPIIKTNIPCNIVGNNLLDYNKNTTVTFILIRLQVFVVSVLKSESRIERIRSVSRLFFERGVVYPQLTELNPDQLNVAELAAYMWLANVFALERLQAGPHHLRVTVVDGEDIASSPESTITKILSICGIASTGPDFKALVNCGHLSRHSKDPSRIYDAAARADEIALLTIRFTQELDSALKWVAKQNITLHARNQVFLDL